MRSNDKAAADKGKRKRSRKRKVSTREAEGNAKGEVNAQEAGLSLLPL